MKKSIKLGGSLITKKDEPYKMAHGPRLSRIARESSDANVVYFGGGGFGHGAVAEKGIDTLNGVSYVRNRMHELAKNMSKHYINQETPTPIKLYPPSNFIEMDEGRISKCSALEEIVSDIEKGFTVVMWGDVVSTPRGDFGIVSGDDLQPYFANELDIGRLVYAVDVNAIYDDDPKINPDANPIRRLDRPTFKKIKVGGSRVKIDQTGGMYAKVNKAFRIIEDPETEVLFVNGKEPGYIETALSKGEEAIKEGEIPGTYLDLARSPKSSKNCETIPNLIKRSTALKNVIRQTFTPD